MRLGAWLYAGAWLLCGSCSGGYPLAPTPCDDWCDATKGSWSYSCGGEYRPASCVSQCEAEGLSNQHCQVEFDAAIYCYRHTPGAANQQCYFDPNRLPPCQFEVTALAACASQYLQGSPNFPETQGAPQQL